jgi:hypothetical protein
MMVEMLLLVEGLLYGVAAVEVVLVVLDSKPQQLMLGLEEKE